MLCVLTDSIFMCDLCVSGIRIIQNEICWLKLPGSCYVRGTIYLTLRKKDHKTLIHFKKFGYSEEVIMGHSLRF